MLNPLVGRRAAGFSLADFTQESLIVPQVRERDPAGVIHELSEVLHRHGRVPDLLPFYHAALNREYLVSTAMDHGMAFPHARLSGLKELSFALGLSQQPIVWGPKGAVPVRLVFLMAIPASDTATYLPLVSGLARLGRNARLLEALRSAANPAAILAILGQIKPGPQRQGTD